MISILIVFFLTHFFADFVCQTDTMAQKKSNSLKWLLIHCLMYGAVSYTCLSYLVWDLTLFLNYCVFLTLTHIVIDFVTSKLTRHYWSIGKRHEFFSIIGLDQLLHQITILLTCKYFLISY